MFGIFGAWRGSDGKRTLSPNVAALIAVAVTGLAHEAGIRESGWLLVLFFVVFIFAGTRRVSEGERGDAATKVAFYTALAVLAVIFASLRGWL